MFGLGEAIYSFEHFNAQNGLSFNDGYYTIVLNLKCEEDKIPEELKTFYKYANEQEVAEEDSFISRLHSDLVKFTRRNGGADMSMQGFMTFEKDMEINMRWAREEGRLIGEIDKAKSIAKAMRVEGMDDMTISKLTGLNAETLNEL